MKQLPLTILLATLLNATALLGQQDTFTPIELKEDLQVYKETIYKVHPAPFQWFPKDSFDIWLDKIESQLTVPMTEIEFRKLIFPVQQKIGCGHSRASSPYPLIKAERKAYKKGGSVWLPPFNGAIAEGKFYVLKDLSKDSLFHEGTQILEMNGLPMPQIIDSLSRFVTSDGFNTTHYHKVLSKVFPVYHRRYFGEQQSYQIKYRDTFGVEHDKNVEAYMRTRAKTKEAKKELKKNPPKAKQFVRTQASVFRKKGYQLNRSLIDTSLYILRIPSFEGKRGTRFYKKTFKYLSELPGEKNLAIDLRDNGGGSAAESASLISMLVDKEFSLTINSKNDFDKALYKNLTTNSFARWRHKTILSITGEKGKKENFHTFTFVIEPHKKFRFKDPVYVLTDGYTFSASTLVCAYLKDQNRATFIGEETGGGQFGTNALFMPRLILPYSKIKVRIPFWQLIQNVEGENIGRGIFPDIPTTWTIDNLLTRKDPDMQALIDDIKKKRN